MGHRRAVVLVVHYSQARNECWIQLAHSCFVLGACRRRSSSGNSHRFSPCARCQRYCSRSGVACNDSSQERASRSCGASDWFRWFDCGRCSRHRWRKQYHCQSVARHCGHRLFGCRERCHASRTLVFGAARSSTFHLERISNSASLGAPA